jgi:hypothetical protein
VAPLYRDDDGVSCTVKVAEVTADEIDDAVSGTAHLFQQRVDKVADARVTVIGDHVFTVRIDSDLLDWRTDYDRVTCTPMEPPPDLTAALYRYLSFFGLVFGCFDFAIDREGQWWFLECNPSGQWAWLEPETGLPMVAARVICWRGRRRRDRRRQGPPPGARRTPGRRRLPANVPMAGGRRNGAPA